MQHDDDFVSQVQERLRKKQMERDGLQAQLAGVQRALIEIEGQIARYQTALDAWREVMVRQENEAEPEVVRSAPNPDPPMGSIATMARSIMASHGGRMRVADVVTELQRLGKLKGGGTSGRGDYGTVFRTLDRDRRFRRVAKGEYQLVSERPAAIIEPRPPSATTAP